MGIKHAVTYLLPPYSTQQLEWANYHGTHIHKKCYRFYICNILLISLICIFFFQKWQQVGTKSPAKLLWPPTTDSARVDSLSHFLCIFECHVHFLDCVVACKAEEGLVTSSTCTLLCLNHLPSLPSPSYNCTGGLGIKHPLLTPSLPQSAIAKSSELHGTYVKRCYYFTFTRSYGFTFVEFSPNQHYFLLSFKNGNKRRQKVLLNCYGHQQLVVLSWFSHACARAHTHT